MGPTTRPRTGRARVEHITNTLFGDITLSLSDGSELGRHIPDGDTTLGPLFDAIRTP